MMRTIVMIILGSLLLINCSSRQIVETEYQPDPIRGCASQPNSQARLRCIGNMLRTIEQKENASVVSSREIIGRSDWEFVRYRYTHCLVNIQTQEEFNCIRHEKEEYEPTLLKKSFDYGRDILAITGIALIILGAIYSGK